MEKLLLEIGAEEIPAGYIEPALHAMQVQLTEKTGSRPDRARRHPDLRDPPAPGHRN